MRCLLTFFVLIVVNTLGCGETPPSRPAIDTETAPLANDGRLLEEAARGPDAGGAVEQLQGTWGIVSAEREGEPLLFTAADVRLTYQGIKVRYEMGTRRRIEFDLDVDGQADPPHYDVRAGDAVELGIYRLEGDLLTICSSRHSRPSDFATIPGDGRTMMVFRRMHLNLLSAPVSKSEADEFGRTIEKSARDGDAAAINALIDLEGILDRITKGLGISETERLSFIHGLRSNSQSLAGGPGSMGGKIAEIIRGGGVDRTLRVTSDGDGWRVLCRLVSAHGGLNYQEFLLGRDAFGNVVASDVLMYAIADLLSKVQFRTLLPSLTVISPTIRQHASPSDRDYIQSGDQVRDYLLRLQSGDFEGAETAYQQLPPSVRSEKWLLLVRLNKASVTDRDRVLQECLSLHPEEPAFALLAFEDAIRRADKDDAFRYIASVEKRVGNDPYLNLLRANVCERVDDLEGSRTFTDAATSAEPELRQFAQRAHKRE